MFCAAIAASQTGMFSLAVCAGLLGIVTIARSAIRSKQAGGGPGRFEFLFELSAFASATLIGTSSALCVVARAAPEIELLVACNAVAYAALVPPRNAGRPLIAFGQLLLVILPLTIALALRGDAASWALALALLLLAGSIVSAVRMFHGVLRRSIAAADTSAQLAERMQQLARTDVVTGLLNRVGIDQILIDRTAALRPGEALALLWFDLDRFKEVNDTHGHQIGDRVLAEVGQRLKAQAPADSALARFGGDEFVVLCRASGRREASQLAEAMLEAVTAPIHLDHDAPERQLATKIHIEIGTSIGVALMPEHGDDVETLLQNADLALYEAKRNGRSQVAIYKPAMTRNFAVRRETEADLRLALERDELSIYFQPIIELNSGRIRTFEALVRWFHPRKGEIAPDDFIPIAEETGAIIPLGNWITQHAAQVAASWPDDVTLAVNLSPLQIRAPGAAPRILAALHEAGLPPHRLELEITEAVLLDHGAQTEAFIAALAEAGVRFALDDFGTGYSSLSYLSKYAFSRIKVDRSFVSGSNAGARSDAIIHAVSEMAVRLDMEIVAEGIETVDQARAMVAMGCTLGQGYHFSRAVPDYLAALLLAQERAQPPQLRLAG